MLAVHWAPAGNVKHILKNGITRSHNGLYCFPLTGHPSLDRWWINLFNRQRNRFRKTYTGIVFRISQEDLPACFGHWLGRTTKDEFAMEIHELRDLEMEFRRTLEWRLGEQLCRKQGIQEPSDRTALDKLYAEIVATELKSNPSAISVALGDLDFMNYTFEDYQIVLSHSIPAKRIVNLLPQGREFGRVIHKRKRNAAQRWDRE